MEHFERQVDVPDALLSGQDVDDVLELRLPHVGALAPVVGLVDLDEPVRLEERRTVGAVPVTGSDRESTAPVLRGELHRDEGVSVRGGADDEHRAVLRA